jgi:hypothetical protein
MSAGNPPKKNAAYSFYVGLVSQANTKLLQANPTLAAGDAKVSIDGAALANLATLPAVTPAAGKGVKVDLSAAEMNGDDIQVVFSDAAGAEWCDLLVHIKTSVRQFSDLAFPATTGRSIVVDSAGLVDANAVKVGPTGAGTAQTAGDVGIKTGFALTSAYDFAKGTVAMTESYAADGAAFTPAQFMYHAWAFLAEKNISGTTLTAKKLDGAATAMTFTLDSATAPTSITRAT